MKHVRPLNARQRQVVAFLCAGLSNKEIASQIRVSEQCVKSHVSRLLRRYEVSSRLALATLLCPRSEPTLPDARLPSDTGASNAIDSIADDSLRHVLLGLEGHIAAAQLLAVEIERRLITASTSMSH